MKVKILQPWICGQVFPPEIGSVIDLPDKMAKDGIDRGLCEKLVEPAAAAEEEKKPGKAKKTG